MLATKKAIKKIQSSLTDIRQLRLAVARTLVRGMSFYTFLFWLIWKINMIRIDVEQLSLDRHLLELEIKSVLYDLIILIISLFIVGIIRAIIIER
jgi:hypothetical protein